MAAKRKKDRADITGLELDEIDKLVLSECGRAVLKAVDVPSVDRVPTGILGFDAITGGGFPRGRMTEISGPESSYKTGLLLNGFAQVTQAGGQALLIDAERSFDREWAEKHGANLDRLRVVVPDTGEHAYDILCWYLRSGRMDLVGLDSIAQVIPQAELEGELTDAQVGLRARLNSKAMGRIETLLHGAPQTALVFVNQIRGNIAPGGMGPTTVTSGGKAIPFYMSLRVKMRRIERVKSGQVVTGARFKAEIHKAKLTGARDGASIEFQVDFDHGFDAAQELLELALEQDLVQKSGSWYTVEGQKFQGDDAVKDFMRGDLTAWRERLLAA